MMKTPAIGQRMKIWHHTNKSISGMGCHGISRLMMKMLLLFMLALVGVPPMYPSAQAASMKEEHENVLIPEIEAANTIVSSMIPQLLSASTSQEQGDNLRVGRLHDIVQHEQYHRQEQLSGAPLLNNSFVIQGVRPFRQLTCNSEILKRSGAPPCTNTWVGLFGTSDTFNNLVTIPCGICVVLNANEINNGSKKLNLLGGIDIQGKLVIPDNNQSLNVTTTHIVVQGELSITSTKTITNTPTIRIKLVGTDNTLSFTPIDINAKACNGQTTCVAGKKTVVIAGGKLTLNGQPNLTPTWTKLYDARGGTSVLYPNMIVVPRSAVGKWGVGAEIVLTSHTFNWDTHQVRTIIQQRNIELSAYVAFVLNEPVVRPTTTLESPDFAVEVALLSRNIVFEGVLDDVNTRHGGHLIIFHTPTIAQQIIGVDFQNFGQQGLLGRYPIHFHQCLDVSGSVVSKNTIRQSNQRCVAIHGTNKVVIQENVAYDTKGHCYYTEDGTETGNVFRGNIGIQTGPVNVLIPSNPTANNGDETDNQPSTFWITNPYNTWYGNVAAGSQNSGYWFDPKLRGPLAYLYKIPKYYNPETISLIEFKNNAAHSIGLTKSQNSVQSIAFRMYTPGYMPTTTATLDGIRSYRNAVGINIHTCHRILLTNSLFADNYRSIELERSEDLRVSNTIIVGESDSFKQLRTRQNVPIVCSFQEVVGIRLGTWQNKKAPGYVLSNVTFTGFHNAACPNPKMFKFFDHTLKQGIFETMTTFKNTRFVGGAPLVDMCLINDDTFDMFYINDLNGNFHPTNNGNGVPGTLVANDNNQLLKFVIPTSKCTSVPSGCYSYCRGTCFRTLRINVDDYTQTGYKLKVCIRGVTPQVCTTFKGGRRDVQTTYMMMAHMPVGQLYDAMIVNENGNLIIPTQSYTVNFEDNQCGTSEQFGLTLAGYVGTIPFIPWTY